MSRNAESRRVHWPALRMLWSFVRPYKMRIVIALLFMFSVTGFELALPYLVKIAIDDYIVPGTWSLGIWVIPTYFGCLLGLGITEYFRTFWMDMTAQYIMRDVRVQLFHHMIRLPIRYFHKHPAGKLVTRVANDVDAMQELLSQGIVAMLADLLVSVAIFGALVWLNPLLAGVVFLGTPLVVGVSFLFRHHAQKAQEHIRTTLSHLNAFTQEHISGLPVLRLYAAEKESISTMHRRNLAYTQANIEAVVHYAWYYPAIRSIEIITTLLTLVVGGWLFIRGHVTLGIIVAFIQYIKRFFEPLADLSDKYNIFVQASVAAGRIYDIFQQKPDHTYRGQSIVLKRPPEVRIQQLYFRYHEDQSWVLKNINLTIPAGERWAIGGVTGAGKSTLMRLLLRFEDPQKGTITLNGYPLQQVRADALRSTIGIAFQEPFLFSATVRENIVLERDPSLNNRLEKLLREWEDIPIVRKIRSKLDLPLTERGQNLSQSERQVITLLRAVLHDPHLVILDEAMSALDAEAEHQIHTLIEKVVRGRTVLIIAHRLNTLPRVDRVVILHDGTIVESGHPEELLQQDSIFANLVRLHSLDEIGMTAQLTGSSG